jgi:hypothetical protein
MFQVNGHRTSVIVTVAWSAAAVVADGPAIADK